ncbi:hypothetical protein L7F22_034090 [Adiantum nelumboides]|nr:hypothetical protein [Adiantum nelumboides]
MSDLKPIKTYLAACIVIVLAARGAATGGGEDRRERVVVYIHDTTLLKNASMNTAAQAVGRSASMSTDKNLFGSVYVFEDPLTTGAARGSRTVGSAQGMYVYTGRSALGSLWAFTVFLEQRGSISVMGAELIMQPSRLLPVVGGTRHFALARGLVNLTTIAFKVPTYFVLRLDFDLLLPSFAS